MSFEIVGEYNTATVQTPISKEDADDGAIEQIQKMVDHTALAGNNDIKIMPDFHWGSGAVIGFTMPLKDRVVPNIVGVDVGCGMSYAYLNDISPDKWDDDVWAQTVDEKIRNTIPFGFNVRSEPTYHLINEFPFEQCEVKLDSILKITGYGREDLPDWFDGYGGEYFKELCKRVEYDVNRAINSLGTLGGGNHFIELSRSEHSGQVVVIIHSGSRGIGAAIANHWQNMATEHTFKRRNMVEVTESEAKYFGYDVGGEYRPDSLSIEREAVLEDYDGEAIDGKFGQLKQFMNAGKEDAEPLDWLEGEEMLGYFIDMIFAQTYASESRRVMVEDVADILDAEIDTFNESVHNYIDFSDGIIRKGATPARDGEEGLIPYNMRDGSILFDGSGNSDWNESAPHGAGRVMSRTAAKNQFGDDEVAGVTDEIHTTNVPLDELPESYKDADLIEQAIAPTADIIDRLPVLQNLKA